MLHRSAWSFLDRSPRPTLGARGYSTYIVFGVVGWLAGLALILVLGQLTHAGVVTRAILAVVPAAALLASLWLASVGYFATRVVFYEKALLALGATAFALFSSGEPVIAGLDLATLGVGTFLAFGRLGCFSVACCHGRRAAFGVRYGWRHAAAGFPKRWVGLTLFPLQLVDGALSAAAVAVGSAVELAPHMPGSPLAAYACSYGLGRFVLEFWRGDAARRYVAGATEAQRTAAFLSVAIAAFRPSRWTWGTAGLLIAALALLAIARRYGMLRDIWLTSAQHVAEVDRILASLIANGPAQTTSEGISLQLSLIEEQRFRLALTPSLAPRTLRFLAKQLGRRWTVVGVEHGAIVVEARVPPEALIDN